ncbi:Immunity protein WapI [compost metagenome]
MLHRSFPYQDAVRLKKDFAEAFAHLKEGWFDGKFSEYCALIAGTISYVIHNSVTEIPQRQLALLRKSFFERYPAYAFIQPGLSDYPTISADLEDHERARGMLLRIIKENKNL